MNALEDEIWTSRAAGLARRGGSHAAVLVRRGKVLGEQITWSSEGPWTVLAEAGKNGGGTLYLSFSPDASLIEAARTARLQRVVTPVLAIDLLLPATFASLALASASGRS